MKRQRLTSPLLTSPRVLIAIPLATPLIYWRTVSAILEMEKPPESHLTVFQGALVDRARNRLVEQMLEHPMKPTHLFFLDADIVPHPRDLRKLLRDNRSIVSGLYRKRLPPYEPMAFRSRAGKWQPIGRTEKGLRKVDVVGAGCLLIRREVFESVPFPWFSSEWRPEGHLSEDFSFCQKARETGHEIYVDTRVKPLHLEPIGIGTSADGKAQFIPQV